MPQPRKLLLFRPPPASRGQLPPAALLHTLVTFSQQLDSLTFRTVRRRIQQHHLPSIAAEMVYNLLLTLLAGGLFGVTAIAVLATRPAPWSLLAQGALPQTWAEWGLLPTLAGDSSRQTLLLLGIGLPLGLWGGMGVARALMRALDTIHGNRPRPFWATQTVALGLLFSGLMVGYGVTTLIGNHYQFTIHLEAQAPTLWVLAALTLWQLLGGAGALMLMTLAFVGLYRWVPHRWRPGTPCLPGAVLAAFSWGGVSLGLGAGHQALVPTVTPYGLVISGLLILIWLYLGALLLLVGAQLNVTVGKRLQRLALHPQHQGQQVMPPSFESFTIRRRDPYR